MDDKEIEHRLTEAETRLDELESRQDDLDKLVSAVNVLAVREENMENDVKEIKADVKMLTSKPGKMWESMMEKITLTVAAAVVGYILAHIGF